MKDRAGDFFFELDTKMFKLVPYILGVRERGDPSVMLV